MENLKKCFLYENGEVVEDTAFLVAIENWIGLESSEGMAMLNLEEVKKEMNIEYLVGLRQLMALAIPEGDEEEEPELEDYLVRRNMNTNDDSEKEELDLSSAIQLASSIKSTACKVSFRVRPLGKCSNNNKRNSILILFSAVV